MIGINYIDTIKPKAYNINKACLYRKSPCDNTRFCGRIIRFNMNVIEEINKLKQNKSMKNSLVAFVPDVLENYFNGNISKNEMVKIFDSNMNKTKFYLSQMPAHLIKENQNTFKKEFAFADKINKILKTTEDESQFYREILESTKKYLSSYQDDACGR